MKRVEIGGSIYGAVNRQQYQSAVKRFGQQVADQMHHAGRAEGLAVPLRDGHAHDAALRADRRPRRVGDARAAVRERTSAPIAPGVLASASVSRARCVLHTACAAVAVIHDTARRRDQILPEMTSTTITIRSTPTIPLGA
jgi:hypothetical protein